MKRIATAAIIAAALSAGAAAQTPAASQGSPTCKEGVMPFEATPANRLTGSALLQAVSGKRLTYLRESTRTPGAWVNNMRDYRADGSFVYICEYGNAPGGPWRPCGSFGSVEKRVAGSRDVGVWSIKNEALCAAKSSFGANTEDCFAIHRQGATYAAKRVSGPRAVCMAGAVTLQ